LTSGNEQNTSTKLNIKECKNYLFASEQWNCESRTFFECDPCIYLFWFWIRIFKASELNIEWIHSVWFSTQIFLELSQSDYLYLNYLVFRNNSLVDEEVTQKLICALTIKWSNFYNLISFLRFLSRFKDLCDKRWLGTSRFSFWNWFELLECQLLFN
jgi:hypothetical protein